MVGGTRSGGLLRFGDGKKKGRMVVVESGCEVRKGVEKGKESSFSSRSNELGTDHGECGKDEVDCIGKKRKLDVFEFDEYDRFDADLKLKKESGFDEEGDEAEGKTFGRVSGEAKDVNLEAGTSGGNVVVYKRRSSFKSDADISSSVRNKITKQSMNGNADSLFSSKRLDASSESNRVHSKNGVLNLGVNKTRGSSSLRSCNRLEAEASETLNFGSGLTRNGLDNSSSVLEARFADQSGAIGRTGKAFLNLHKSMSAKTGKKQDPKYNDSDTPSNSGRDLDSHETMSRSRFQGNTSTPCKSTLAVPRSRHESSNRRGGTEKQKVRERIKQTLVDAGWTIDYRPRRDRGYSDAVYVNRSGTCYWSIIKAYDALQKEAVDTNERIKSEEESPFTPLPETILCKLTRNTRQKLKKEKRNKHLNISRSGRLNRDSARSLKVKSESEETTSDDEEEEKQRPRNKKFGRSMKDGNNLNRNPGSHYFRKLLHDKDLEYEDRNKRRMQLKARQNKKLGKSTLLVRSADKGMNPDDGYVPYTGKRTLLSWLIDSGTVEVNEKIQFMNRTRKRALQQGSITRDGIHCVCCNKILTIAKFEIHAGSKFQQPLQSIFTESGVLLSQCLLDAWNHKAESGHIYFHNVDVDGDDPNDDTCSICGDGGDLICCDGCPSTFHQNCLGIKVLPEGDWRCPQCICIYCGVIDETGADGDTSKCSLRTCSLCEMKYHHSCLMELESYADISSFHFFCGSKCDELHKILQKSVGVRYELEEGFSWTLIRRTKVDSSDSVNQNLVCNAKLAIAQTIMDECFLPIVDRRSQVNLIHNVLYNCGSNFNRLNYQGFYTAILEKGDEIISAASLRFHGTHLAEMPFIGTRHIYRRQGMCRRLLSAIESALRSYKVEKLVIPAISQLLHTWTDVFGFYHLERSDKEKLRSFNIMVFPGVDMLHKVLIETARLEDTTVVKTGLYNEEASTDLVCQDSGRLTSPNSPLDDKNACTEPINGIVENMKEPCIASEHNKVCADDVVTNKYSDTPDLGESQDCPPKKEVP